MLISRASRPYSRESLLSNTSLGSKVRFSQFSCQSRCGGDDGATTIDDCDDCCEEDCKRDPKSSLQVINNHFVDFYEKVMCCIQARVIRMFANISRANSMEIDDSFSISKSEGHPSAKPKSFLGKVIWLFWLKYLELLNFPVQILLWLLQTTQNFCKCATNFVLSFGSLDVLLFRVWLRTRSQEVSKVTLFAFNGKVLRKERIDLRILRNDTFQRISAMVMDKRNVDFE